MGRCLIHDYFFTKKAKALKEIVDMVAQKAGFSVGS